MSTFHETIRTVLAEFDKFLGETLKSEKLSKKVLQHKEKILELLKKLRDDWPQLAPDKEKTLTIPVKNERDVSDQSLGTGSSGTTEEEENSYSENVPATAAKDLTNPQKSGYLEKKRKKESRLLSPYQKRYCVIHKQIFYYYEKPTDKKQYGAFSLVGYEFREAPHLAKDASKKELSFELVAPAKRCYQFIAETKEEFQSWKEVIEKSSIAPTESETVGFEGTMDEIYEDIGDMEPRAQPQNNDGISAPEETYDGASSGSAKSFGAARKEAMSSLPEVIGMMEETYDDCDNIKPDDDEPPPPPPPPRPAQNHPPVKPDIPLPAAPSKPDIPLPAVPNIPPPAVPSRTYKPEKTPPPKKQIVRPTEDFENMFYGKWDCQADVKNELSFKRGDIIHIISHEFEDKNWLVGELNGNFGLVPKQYLIRAYELIP